MDVARRPEGPEVNGDLRKTVSRRSLVPSRELKAKGIRRFELVAGRHAGYAVAVEVARRR